MENFKKRMFTEYTELNEKIFKASKSLHDQNFCKTLGEKKIGLLSSQLKYMKDYRSVLRKRMELENFNFLTDRHITYGGKEIYKV